jgi:ATP-binding cassette subfamily C (CFTR/MRP) protein 1
MLCEIKAIRMTGLSSMLSSTIHDLRVKELKMSKSYRRLNVVMNAIGTLLQVMGPVTAFIFYVLLLQTDESKLDPSTTFTALSLISLLSSPIFLFMHTLPAFTASLGCYDRIQRYLLYTEKTRDMLLDRDIKRSNWTPPMHKMDLESDVVELKTWGGSSHSAKEDLVLLDQASFSFKDRGPVVLEDISFSLKKGSLTILTGPVGSGKSALLLAILGELRLLSGTVQKSPSLNIGICEQTPWLPNISARQIILGSSELDID